MSTNTMTLYNPALDYLASTDPQPEKPRLFVCCDHEILEFILDGRQYLGRPSDGVIPDIPIVNKYVSRRQGWFETKGNVVTFTPEDTTNSIVFRRKVLVPGETIELWDGDELIIPLSRSGEAADIMLVCAILERRINIWRDLRLASRDALTGLSGRNAFRTWYIYNYPWKESANNSLFILDIDYFKRINDVYGHFAGDDALKILTKELLLLVENTGYVCRWGGDEFVGIMPGEKGHVQEALEQMRRKLSETVVDDSFTISISAGVVGSEQAEQSDIDSMVLLADKALYQAKENGRGCVCVYDG